MQQHVQKLKVKSAFLLQNLLVGHPEHKGGVARAGGLDGPQGKLGDGAREGAVHRRGMATAPLTHEALPSGTLCSMGMVQQLVALVRTEHSPFHEHVLGALCRCAGALRECSLGWVPPPPKWDYWALAYQPLLSWDQENSLSFSFLTCRRMTQKLGEEGRGFVKPILSPFPPL